VRTGMSVFYASRTSSSARALSPPASLIFRRAVVRGDVAINPTTGLELPAVRGVRERIATPDEAVALIDAVPIADGALWATAMYAGLRLGELVALDWSAVDFEVGVIRVERSWDPKEGVIEPKSRAGRRVVPIPSGLRRLLLEHRMRQGRAGRGLAFGRSETRPFNPPSVQRRARIAWSAADLTRITPHECRHTFASMMIAAGINAKTLSTYMGHANIAITMDRYGHLMPGNEQEAAGLLDAYLQAAVVSAASS
jgi:integrase